MSLPLISIVTISLNQVTYLEECLRSVVDQRGAEVDYIVVDAGSTDGSRAMIEAYSAYIQTTIFEPDDGPADGLNKGFRRARGSVFGYVNADDRLAPGALRTVAGYFADHPEIDVVTGAISLIDGHGRAALRRRTADPFDLARYAAGVCTIGQQATFFRREAFESVGGFNAANRISWDGELLVDMALAGARFATVPQVLGDFRKHAAAITGTRRQRAHQLVEHYRLGDKIAQSGVAVYDPMAVRLLRAVYFLDPIRHLRYLLTR